MPSETQNKNRQIRFRYPLSVPLKQGPNYFWVSDKMEVMVLMQGGKIRIFGSICPHMGAQIQYDAGKSELYCPWHNLRCKTQTLDCDHPRFPKLHEYPGEVVDNVLVIYA